jgi:hypothetical protein
MNHVKYSHLGGKDEVSAKLQAEIEHAIAAITVKPALGAATKIRDVFLKGIAAEGWSGEAPVSMDSNITVTSTKNDVYNPRKLIKIHIIHIEDYGYETLVFCDPCYNLAIAK